MTNMFPQFFSISTRLKICSGSKKKYIGGNMKTVFISCFNSYKLFNWRVKSFPKIFPSSSIPKICKKKKFPEAKNKNNKATIENRFQYRYFRLKRYMTRNLSGSVIFDVACKWTFEITSSDYCYLQMNFQHQILISRYWNLFWIFLWTESC